MMRLALTLLLFFGAAGAGAEDFTEGEHYTVLESPQPTSVEEGEVEVLEFFSYGCGHCYEFEESLEAWAGSLPESVDFQRVPAGLGRRFFQYMAVLYHVSEHLGVLDTMHPVLFDEIHEQQNQAIGTRDGLGALYREHAEVSIEQLEAAMQSPEVMQGFQRTEGMQARYQLRGVPMMVVNGKYTVSRNASVTSYEQMLAVVDYLVKVESGAVGP